MLERQRRKYKNPSSVDSDTEGVVTNTWKTITSILKPSST
jgi:hypothetical protein